MYNSPGYMFIYADANCMPRFDVINKISSGISLINSCQVAGSHETHLQLCNLLHKEKEAQLRLSKADPTRLPTWTGPEIKRVLGKDFQPV